VRLAVIDCGTNTFHVLIVERINGTHYERVFNTRFAVKLGENTINKGFIADVPFKRGIDALSTFKKHIDEYKVDRILAFATSAIRDAANGEEFVKKAFDETGIEIEVIDGNKEAVLIYHGCRSAMKLGKEKVMIMDIGGGSTEFIIANEDEIFWKHSFNLGAARLLEKFQPDDPISKNGIEKLNEFLRMELHPLFLAVKNFPVNELIGSSGAFDSVIEMICGELGGEEMTNLKTEYPISLDQYKKISDLVKKSNLEERKKIKGLIPMRFDMIVISILLIDFIMNEFALLKMRVSTYSLKEGAVVAFLQAKN
jgi:exopolyphosphatase/guanosine-5'-triphosphate,3'-diphosphate pyrophosphatase